MNEFVHDLSIASLKSAPPVTVWFLTLNEWVAVAAIIYTALQAAHLVWKWRREAKAKAAT